MGGIAWTVIQGQTLAAQPTVPGGMGVFGQPVFQGGVDIDEVYNFAWFQYAVVSGVVIFTYMGAMAGPSIPEIPATEGMTVIQDLPIGVAGGIFVARVRGGVGWTGPASFASRPAPATTFGHLDSTIRLERYLTELGIYPAVDPLTSTSRVLDPLVVGQEHYEVAREVQRVLQRYRVRVLGSLRHHVEVHHEEEQPQACAGHEHDVDRLVDAQERVSCLDAAAPRLQWVGYLSTTGVYGDHLGGWVDETTPLTPSTMTSLKVTISLGIGSSSVLAQSMLWAMRRASSGSVPRTCSAASPKICASISSG